jgi:hypothetical protein
MAEWPCEERRMAQDRQQLGATSSPTASGAPPVIEPMRFVLYMMVAVVRRWIVVEGSCEQT